MHRHYHGHPGEHFLRRRGRPPFGGIRRGRLLGELLAGGLGYMIGRQQAENQKPSPYQQPQNSAQNDQLTQLKLLGQLRDSGVLTEEEFQAQKRKILQ